MRRILAYLLCLSTSAFASGYKIPEQSIDSTALSGASVAGSYGADASYYNPANMALSPSGSEIELSGTYIHLTSVRFSKGGYSENSKRENFLAPRFLYRGESKGDWRFGFAFVTPAGLSKRWEDGTIGKMRSNEFTLEVFELNPSVAYRVSDSLAIGAGVRGIYTKGLVKNDLVAQRSFQELKGDTIDSGYNLALSYKPNENSTLALTYRSKVNLTVSGDAGIRTPYGNIESKVAVKVPLPATLAVAFAQKWEDFLFEATWDKTYWSAYKSLDFKYENSMTSNPILRALDAPKIKDWKDTDAFRFGISYFPNRTWKFMAGFAIDENPIPDKSVDLELPDSYAKIYSFGARYRISQESELGMAFLLSDKNNRNASIGSFSNTQAHLVTLGYTYRY
ncbi:MAG: OmpP1/FadL family transporter [Wolinella sp.]